MIDFTNTEIEQLVIHRVGNKQREEANLISETLTTLNAELEELLIGYFGKSFIDHTETYRFVHDIDISYNELNGISKEIFEDPGDFYNKSVLILKHLYEQSSHPHIKAGDLFICEFTGVLFDNESVSAIGIFKSERKDSFLKLSDNEKQIVIDKHDGISIKKLDKGAIILNFQEEDGFRVLSVDNNKYDAEYWKVNFLNIDYLKDEKFETKNYLNLCKSFATEVIAEKAGKKEQIDFLNQTVKYFDNNDEMDVKDFADSLFENEDTVNAFNSFKKRYEDENDLEFSDKFELSKTVFKKEKRSFKNFIKLDTNIQIKLDFNNPESTDKFVEKGYDQEKEMYYYKVFFNKEI